MTGVFILLGVLLGLKLVVDELTRDRKRQRRKPRYRTSEQRSGADIVADGIVAAIRRLIGAFAPARHSQHYQSPPQPPPVPQPPEVESQPVEIEVTCPTCKSVLIAPSDMAGQEATCESCRAIVQVPPLPVPAVRRPPSPPRREVVPQITGDLLRELEWKRFEQVIEAYFERTGWRTQPARIGADGGVDIHLFRPQERTVGAVVQCKAWTTYKVGVKPVRELFGVMAAESVSEGFFVTAGEYTEEARSFARGKTVTLIDGGDLIQRIKALPREDQCYIYNIATAGDYKTPTCPRCGRKMVRRIGAKGRGAGVPFWGCPGYPRCKMILKTRSDEE